MHREPPGERGATEVPWLSDLGGGWDLGSRDGEKVPI